MLSALTRRVRRTSLGVKLALLSGVLTVVVLGVALSVLAVEVRGNTRSLFVAELTRNQGTLRQLQAQKANELRSIAAVLTQNATLGYTLDTYRVEANGGAPRADLIATVEQVLESARRSVNKDVLIATDDSGRVIAAAPRRGPTPPRRASLLSLPAVRHALNPALPADSGELSVLRSGNVALQVAVYPIVFQGLTLGTMLLGERLDSSFVASIFKAFNGHVALTLGDTIVSGTLPALTPAAIASARAQSGDGIGTINLSGEEYVAAPVPLGDTQDGQRVRLWMLQPLSASVRALMRPVQLDFALYGLLAALAATLGAALMARSVLRPFHAFVSYMRSGAATERRQEPFEAEATPREVRTLNESFDQLMDSLAGKRAALEHRTSELAAANAVLTDEIQERTRVEAALRDSEAQLRQSQKLEAIGTLAGGIAHDFNNLITVISGYTQLALMRADKGSAAAADLRQVVEASERAAKLTHQLLAFSRKQVMQPTVLDLADVVNGVAPMLRRIIGEHIHLEIQAADDLARVRADRGQLEQVILNLAVNARDAMPRGGTLEIDVANATDAEVGNAVALTVRDNGTGMPPSVRERVFEPFFTTKEAGKGTGLGLSTVYGIVKQSGGTISVDSSVGVGTTFTMMLPAADPMAVLTAIEGMSLEFPRGTETVLIVEDADDVRALARRALAERGYSVLVARDPLEALEVAGARKVDVLLTDIVMPHLSGPQFVARYLEQYPAPVVIYMSGYSDDALAQYELDATAVFLRKPFTPSRLARTVRDAIDAASAASRSGAAD